jgi:PAS domain S-box-containing protein
MEIALPQLPGIGLHLSVIMILVALAAYLWHYRKAPGVLPLISSLGARILWLTCIVMFSASSSLPWQIFWNKLAFLNGVILIPSWLVLILQVSGRGSWLTWRRLAAIIFAPAVGILLIFTNEWHGWFTARGILHWLILGYNYLLALACWYINIQWIRQSSGLRRRQAVIIAIGPLFSLAGQVAGLSSHWVYASMLLPVGFLLSALMWCWALLYWRTLNIIPIAKDTVITNMGDGFAVVDNQGYIYELNPAAAAMLGISVSQAVGRQAAEVFAGWPALTGIGGNSGQESMEVTREHPEGTRYYLLTVTSLQTGAYWLGKVIVLKDITRQKKDQEKLLETEKALSILSERDRLGRELHDGQGQIWNYLKMELNTVRALLNSGQIGGAGKQVDWLIGTVKELNTDARESIVGLKNPIDISDDFITYLEDYLEWYEKNNGIATRLILPAEPVKDLLSQIKFVQLLRIIQEALTNIRKHAKAKQVKVIFQKVDNLLRILVEDDGCGFETTDIRESKKSFGLQIMAERAAEEGGRLWIESKPGAGTKVMVEFSLNKTESKEGHHENAIGG